MSYSLIFKTDIIIFYYKDMRAIYKKTKCNNWKKIYGDWGISSYLESEILYFSRFTKHKFLTEEELNQFLVGLL
jgi:hypothetical protein